MIESAQTSTPNLATRPSRLPAFFGRHRTAVQWLAGILALIATVGFHVLPIFLRSTLENVLSDTLLRKVSITRLVFNPFALSLELRGVRADDGEGRKVLGFDKLYVNVGVIESLVRRGLVLTEARLEGPYAHVTRREDGSLDWADTIAALSAPSPEPVPAQAPAPRFSLNNIQVLNGRFELDDKPVGRQHRISDFRLGVPFISNLPSKVDIYVQPHLAARVNDASFDLQGQARPFASERDSTLDIKLDGLDLTPFQDYLPFARAWRLQGAALSSALELRFAQPAEAPPRLSLSGEVRVDGFDLRAADDAPLAGFERLRVELGQVDVMARQVEIKAIELQAPSAEIRRAADGSLNLAVLAPPAAPEPVPTPAGKGKAPEKAAAKTAPEAADKTAADGKAADQNPAAQASQDAAPPMQLRVQRIAVDGGRINVDDQVPKGGFATRLHGLDIEVTDLAWPATDPAGLSLAVASERGERIALKARFHPATLVGQGQFELAGIPLAAYMPYYGAALNGGAVEDGVFGSEGEFTLAGSAPDAGHEARLKRARLEQLALRLPAGRQPFLRLGALQVDDLSVAPARTELRIARLALEAPALDVVRLADGGIDLLALAPPPGPEGAPAAAPSAAAKPWALRLDSLAISDGRVHYEDRGMSHPAAFVADQMRLEAGPLVSSLDTRARFDFAARINQGGSMRVEGSALPQPLAVEADLDLKRVDLLPLQSLLSKEFNVLLTRGNVSVKGQLALQHDDASALGLRGGYRGEAAIEDLALLDRNNDADLLRWRRLAVQGVKTDLAPLAVDVEQLAIQDFGARLILNEKGELNLREVAPGRKHAATEGGETPPVAPAAQAQPPAEAASAFRFRLGKAQFKNGQVRFSDHFIRPNFDANLLNLDGELSSLASDSDKLATLSVAGNLGAGAPVAIAGELNPFRRDAYVDIRATVRDYELTSASPYSTRYVGYGIEKGKLSAELNYQVRDRQLTANNRILLDQLTFGEKVDSPDALNLPVHLAVALLKNSRGEIDLELPIAGTLDDPQFSIGGLIVKAIMNLLVKAVTAPFTLLGAIFGGGESLDHVAFAPGTAQLDAAALDKLTALSKALTERPALKLEITGQTDPARDAEGLSRQAILTRMRGLKAREMARNNQPVASVDALEISEAEYPALLERVYRDSDLPNKPRNAIGLAKSLPAAEMEALLIGANQPTAEAFEALARQRAGVIKEWLIGPGKIPAERVYLRATKAEDSGDGLNRVAFSLR